jgi:hypothetical protein
MKNMIASKLKQIAFCMLGSLVAVNALAQGIHVHDAAAEKLAQQAQSAFDQVSLSDTNVFDTMTKNTNALKGQTIQQLYQLNQNAARAAANNIPTMTWTELASELRSYQDDYLRAYQSTMEIMKQAPSQAADVEHALLEANQRVADLQRAVATRKSVAEAEAPKLADMKQSLSTLKKALQGKQVSRLSDLTKYKQFAQVWVGISSAKDWLDKAEKASGGPGEQLIILDLAVQLQSNALKLLQLQQQQLDTQLNDARSLATDLGKAVGSGRTDASGKLVEGDFGKVFTYITPCASPAQCPTNGFLRDPNEQILVTVGTLAEDASKEVGTTPKATLALRNLMDVLARYTSLVGYQRFLLLRSGIEAVTEEQLAAIRVSAVNANSRATLISHGLEGITTYEQGGITPEDVANVFRAAQTIASAVIAGRL